ncbi:MAG TPA: GvpL/GvpF family gas vesicle protein [Solirubrobacteraceae bacterium]|nr:GvpL/GvpF family gas vesicle protein [Solirubrobacteraceae bacterium]
MSATAPVYVYGVVAARSPGRRPPVAGRPGIDGRPVRLVAADGVGAVVSDVPEPAPGFGREALTAHSEVLEAVLAAATVLPMRFGVVLEGERAVRDELLAPHRDELLAQLDRLDGRVELTLRATYQEAPLLREIMAEEAEIAAFHARRRGTYLEQIRLGEMIAAAIDARRRRDAEEILAQLTPLAEDVALGEPRHERMALSASFLIAREGMDAFDAAVDDVGRRQHRRMRLRYTGPLPPHSFVRLEAVG